MLTPNDINNKQFSATRIREGYDQREVDDFLDQVAADWVDVLRELGDLKTRNESLKRRNDALSTSPTAIIPPAPSSPPATVEKIITMAQETADKHIADAKAQADEIVRAAGQQAAKAVEDATRAASDIKAAAAVEAAQIRTQGVAERQKALDDIEARHSQATVAFEGLQRSGDQLREALNQALITYDGRRPQ